MALVDKLETVIGCWIKAAQTELPLLRAFIGFEDIHHAFAAGRVVVLDAAPGRAVGPGEEVIDIGNLMQRTYAFFVDFNASLR